MSKPAMPINDPREIRGWTMYDWANSAFSTTVVTVFLGPYLTSLAQGAADAAGMLYIGNVPIKFDSYFSYCISASVLLQVTILPILGALADYSNMRKRLMMFFSSLGAISTIALFFLTPGLHWLGGLLFILANVSFGASIVFYNAYLPDIASEDMRDSVSSRGFAMGYLGGGLLLLVNLAMYALMEDGALVARLSLASAGFWWLGFSFVTFRALKDRHTPRDLPEGETYLSVGFTQLAKLIDTSSRTIAVLMSLPMLVPVLFFLQPILNLDIRLVLAPALGPIIVLVLFLSHKSKTLPEAMKYLVAYLLYNDGIQTVIAITAIFASQELGMESSQLILVILMIQFVAFGGAHLFNFFASRIGTKRAIITSLVVWTIGTVYAYAGMKDKTIVIGESMTQAQLEFWILAFFLALVLGGSQALSRSLFAQMIPDNQEAEFFSFYEVSERGTSWMGTFVFGIANQISGSMRVGILSVIFFFFAGLLLLPMVNVPRAVEQGKAASVKLAAGD